MQNQYLEQVVQQKIDVERDLKYKSRKRASIGGPVGPLGPQASNDTPAVDVRVTGWWRWKTVVVPPNAYVVHTRRGHDKPLHCGLGTSFRYNPNTDSFLVVPSAMQTIVVNANCIVRERQGVLVQGYVQWMIADFDKAYRVLDFGDPYDPMQVINVQLGEQAEATIKDTVASMSIDDVLADKQPIIEELTRRLRDVAEGSEAGGGLGLRIVTVQIKEAVVSSARLWETIQRPYRAERSKTARLAELTHVSEVKQRENEEARRDAQREIEKAAAIATFTAQSEAKAFDSSQRERARRAELEAQLATSAAEHQANAARLKAQLDRLELELELSRQALNFEAEAQQQSRLIELDAARMKIQNSVSSEHLSSQLIKRLPEIAKAMPVPSELKTIQLGSLDGISALIDSVSAAVRRTPPN